MLAHDMQIGMFSLDYICHRQMYLKIVTLKKIRRKVLFVPFFSFFFLFFFTKLYFDII